MKEGIIFLASLSIVLGLVAAAPGLAATPSVSPGDCTVTSMADSGAGSLRACMAQLGAGDVITFSTAVFPPGNPQTIALSNPLPDIITNTVTIDEAIDAGPGVPWIDAIVGGNTYTFGPSTIYLPIILKNG